MRIDRIRIIAGASAAALALSAAAAQQAEEPAPAGEEAAQETPEEIAARELCTETAAPGAHQGWSIKAGRTCENSFTETCTVIRNSDRVEVAYACFAPLPPMEPLPGEEADAEDVPETEE